MVVAIRMGVGSDLYPSAQFIPGSWFRLTAKGHRPNNNANTRNRWKTIYAAILVKLDCFQDMYGETAAYELGSLRQNYNERPYWKGMLTLK